MHLYTQPMKDWHIDLILKRELTNGWQDMEKLGACYVVPPVGSFIEHESGCSLDRDYSRIPGLWDLPWCQEGTRKRGDHQKDRRLAMFTGWEPVRYLTDEIFLPDDALMYRWLTERIPEDMDVSLSPVLGLRGVWDQPPDTEDEEEAGAVWELKWYINARLARARVARMLCVLSSHISACFMYARAIWEAAGASSSAASAAPAGVVLTERQDVEATAKASTHVYGPHHVPLPRQDFTQETPFEPMPGQPMERKLTKRQKRQRREHMRDYAWNRIFADPARGEEAHVCHCTRVLHWCMCLARMPLCVRARVWCGACARTWCEPVARRAACVCASCVCSACEADVSWRRPQHLSESGDSVLEMRGWTAPRSVVDERVAEISLAVGRGDAGAAAGTEGAARSSGSR